MDALIRALTGGALTRAIYLEDLTMGGAYYPCSSRGLGPDPDATRGDPLQARKNQCDGRSARRAERENGPAAPSRGSDRDKEKP
jgi:hypothetical protein